MSLARQVMQRLPHVLLAGEGADRFARECGLATEPPLSHEAAKEHVKWLSGLGLMQMHNGFIRVNSGEGENTTFTLTF